jgi:hypothetical protein
VKHICIETPCSICGYDEENAVNMDQQAKQLQEMAEDLGILGSALMFVAMNAKRIDEFLIFIEKQSGEKLENCDCGRSRVDHARGIFIEVFIRTSTVAEDASTAAQQLRDMMN